MYVLDMASLTKKLIGGKAYYYLRECQRVGGKPKIIWTKYLGTAENLVERLSAPEPEELSILEFGASAAAFDIARQLKVVETIDRHAPKRGSQGPTIGQYMLLAALNRCVDPRSKSGISDWYGRSVLKRLLPMTESQITPQRFWDNMDRLSEGQLEAIERDLAANAVTTFGLDLRCLLFDATNFFTFIDSFNDEPDLAQRGHSKEGRDNLRLLGLALMVTADGDVPLFHHVYAGNQHDAVTFRNVIGDLAKRCRELADGADDITLVFDKGNNAEDNLAAVEKGPFHFVGSLVPTQHEDLLAIPRKKMKRMEDPQLPAVWSWRGRKNVFGVERTVLCTFNEPLFESQVKTLQREIGKRRTRLNARIRMLDRYRAAPSGKPPTVAGTQKKVDAILSGRHMRQLFATTVVAGPDKLPVVTWEFDSAAWKELKSTLLGKTILFTDRDDWTDEQIILGYRAQHHVEAAFRRMKDPRVLTFRPTFHWTDQKLRVHAFYCVLALMILSLLRRKLQQGGPTLSIRRLVEKLAEIREVTILYPSPKQAKSPITRTKLSTMDSDQRDIFDKLDLNRYASS